ncbi:glycosyltransferase [Leptobacterium sp. I13]|uniref:glycosyltransferase n=1 Tax=Leptobacterium meishanense TaxID=3128904 RepID=UPI0030EDC661
MKLSIIVPVYNMEKYLGICLDSLINQNMPEKEYEVIIVNDGSKDNSLALATTYAQKHTNIVIHDKENNGVGAARNSGLDLAKGEYVYFVDPDDYLAENSLQPLIRIAKKHQLDILTFDVKNVSASDNGQNKPEYFSDKKPNIMSGVSYIANYKYKSEIWWYIIKRDFLLQTGYRFIEGRWMEDAILTAQLFLKAKRMAHVFIDVYRHRVIPTSAMKNKTPEHYKKVIYDNENAAYVFNDLIKTIPSQGTDSDDCKKRLQIRQQSFVFFLMVRLMKSDIPVNRVPEMLKGFEKINVYPLNHFPGSDYKGLRYSLLTLIFNQKRFMVPFIHFFRFFYTIVK